MTRILEASEAKELVRRSACAAGEFERRLAGNLVNLQIDALHDELAALRGLLAEQQKVLVEVANK